MSSSDSQFDRDAQIFSGLSCFTALSCCLAVLQQVLLVVDVGIDEWAAACILQMYLDVIGMRRSVSLHAFGDDTALKGAPYASTLITVGVLGVKSAISFSGTLTTTRTLLILRTEATGRAGRTHRGSVPL